MLVAATMIPHALTRQENFTMPDESEVETEKLREAVHEELEREGGSFLKTIALTTAILAVVAAVAALESGSTVNEALFIRSDASRLQAEASDKWAFYQAKGIKAAVQEASRTSWLSIGKEPPSEYGEKVRRYTEEQAGLQREAQDLERRRDERIEESEHLLHRHHRFAASVVLLQIGIALGAVAALSRQKLIWWASLISGVIGAGLLAVTWLRG